MDLNILIKRVQSLILKPQKEWLLIKDEQHSFRKLFIDYAGPLMTVGAITLFISNLFLEYSIIGNVVASVIYFTSMFGSMYISAIIINELVGSFEIEKNKSNVFILVIYSSTAFYIAQAAVNLHNQLAILGIFSLYSIYLFWTGTEVYFKDLEKRKMGFVIISVFIVFLSYLLIQYIFSSLLILINNSSF